MVKRITRRRVVVTGAATVAGASAAKAADLVRLFATGPGSGSGPPPAPVITSPTTVSGNVGDPFFYQITATNSPTSFGASGLPSDLVVNTSTGTITGTPMTVATTSGTVSATNAGGTGSGPLSITISSVSPGSTAAMALAALTDVNTRGATPFTSSIPSAPNHYLSASGLQQYVGIENSYLAYSVQGTFTSSSFPTTMTLVQDGAVAGGVPTNTFGWVFRPGDIPAGHVPQFKVGGVTWGFSAGLQTYWPDRSLKWAAFALMVPASPPSFPVTIDISDAGAGSWPAASGRTLAEVYLQALVVNLKTPSPAIPNNIRTTDLFAALVGDSNNFYAIKDLDGAAGARWRIKTKAATSIGGTADPEFIIDHYIFAMNNASGGLGGFRWMGNIRNPLRADQSGGSNAEWIALQPPSSGSPSTGLNWSINPGSTPNGGGAVYTPAQHPFPTVNFNNGFATSAASISGNILTITGTPSGFVMPAVNATISSGGGSTVTISATSSPFSVNLGMVRTVLTVPAGITVGGGPAPAGMFGLLSQISSSETDGHFGGLGVYGLDNTSFSSGFTNQTVIMSSQLSGNDGGPVGLYDGGALTGQYQILGQLTTLSGDGPGFRGTYALSGSAGTIGSEAMNYFSALTLQTNIPTNWWSGANSGNRLMVKVTGGSLPPVNPVSGNLPLRGPPDSEFLCAMATYIDGGFYSIKGNFGTQNVSVVHNSGFNNMFVGPGGGTMTPIPAHIKYSRFQLANADGKYWFFQGTGSIVADTTTRVQINQAYWQSSGVITPIDMSLIGVIPNTGYNFDWNPYNCGVCRSLNIDDVGPPYEVGHQMPTCVIDFYVQTKESEKENRIFGLYAGTTPSDWKDKNTAFDQVPPTYGTGTPYTGLPPALQGSGLVYGFYPGIATGISNPTHEPQFGYWAFLRFGELQYFDYMVDWAQIVTGYQQWFGATPSPPWSYSTYGNVCAQGQDRGCAWANRDIQQVAFICSYDPNPGSPAIATFDYGGVALAQYLIDHADDQPRLVHATELAPNIALFGSTDAVNYLIANPGAYREMYNATPNSMTSLQSWEWTGYFYGGFLFAAMRGNTDATAIIANHMAWVDKIANHSIQAGDHGANGYLHFYRVNEMGHSQLVGGTSVGPSHQGTPNLISDGQFSGNTVTWNNGSSITQWIPNAGGSTRAFTMNGTLRPPWYNQNATPVDLPADGDAIPIFVAEGQIIVNDGSKYPTELTLAQVYFIRDLTPVASATGPWQFNLAATKGGPAIAITTTNLSPQMLPLDDSCYITSNPDPLDPCSPDFIRQVGLTWNWIHAVASSTGPNGVNQFAGFT